MATVSNFRNQIFNTPEKCWNFIQFMSSYNDRFERLYYELLRMDKHNHNEFVDYLDGIASHAYNREQLVESICGRIEY